MKISRKNLILSADGNAITDFSMSDNQYRYSLRDLYIKALQELEIDGLELDSKCDPECYGAVIDYVVMYNNVEILKIAAKNQDELIIKDEYKITKTSKKIRNS